MGGRNTSRARRTTRTENSPDIPAGGGSSPATASGGARAGGRAWSGGAGVRPMVLCACACVGVRGGLGEQAEVLRGLGRV